MKYTFNIVLCWDSCESFCFKVGMILDTTKVYNLIPLCMTLIFTHAHRVTGNLERV